MFFEPLFVTVSLSSFSWTSSTKPPQVFWAEFLGCCDVSLCSAEQATLGRVLSHVSFWYNVVFTYFRPIGCVNVSNVFQVDSLL